jgi:ADP-ribose pyrophosphatase
MTPANEIVLIEQYRHGADVVTLEIPGGMVDAGESPIEAAVRELREETGYEGREAVAIGVTRPNPAFQDNRLTTVFVRDCRLVADAHGDEHEEITVRVASVPDVRRLVKDGAIDHSLVLAAFAFTALAADRGVPNLLG